MTKEEGAVLSQSSNSENCQTNHLTINVHHFTAALEVVFDHKNVCR
jgi:hypothetical protein